MKDNREVEMLQAIADPVERARAANELATEYRERGAQIARIRQETLLELNREKGMTYEEIGRELNMTPQRAHQLATARRRDPDANKE
jgi:hypothetical protein